MWVAWLMYGCTRVSSPLEGMFYNPTKDRRERVGRLLRMYADRREDLEEILAGDIGAVVGLKNHSLVTPSVMHPTWSSWRTSLSQNRLSRWLSSPKTSADQDKMGEALHKLSEEDPTFRVRVDEETGQTIIAGMGELHLEILVDRMLREFRVQARVGRPQVAYRETITAVVPKAEYRYVKQSGGRGQYGHVIFELRPGEPGSGIVFENGIIGGDIPKEQIPVIEKGVRESAEAGVLARYPVVDMSIRVYGGSYHEVDSNEMAFKMAASLAFKRYSSWCAHPAGTGDEG